MSAGLRTPSPACHSRFHLKHPLSHLSRDHFFSPNTVAGTGGQVSAMVARPRRVRKEHSGYYNYMNTLKLCDIVSHANDKLTSAVHGRRLETRMAYGVWCSAWFAIQSMLSYSSSCSHFFGLLV